MLSNFLEDLFHNKHEFRDFSVTDLEFFDILGTEYGFYNISSIESILNLFKHCKHLKLFINGCFFQVDQTQY